MRLIVSLACCCLLVATATTQTPPRPIANRSTIPSEPGLASKNTSSPTDGVALDARHQAGGEPGGDGAAPVPEPSALFLVGSGLLGIAITARLRRRERPGTTAS